MKKVVVLLSVFSAAVVPLISECSAYDRVRPRSSTLLAGFRVFPNAPELASEDPRAPFEQQILIENEQFEFDTCPNTVVIGPVIENQGFAATRIEVTTVLVDTNVIISC